MGIAQLIENSGKLAVDAVKVPAQGALKVVEFSGKALAETGKFLWKITAALLSPLRPLVDNPLGHFIGTGIAMAAAGLGIKMAFDHHDREKADVRQVQDSAALRAVLAQKRAAMAEMSAQAGSSNPGSYNAAQFAPAGLSMADKTSAPNTTNPNLN